MEHLDKIFQIEPQFYKNESKENGVPGVTSIVYKDIPEKGSITGITYGLSLVKHPSWKYGRPELIITVDSTDLAWGQVVGFLANNLRGDCPFTYGNKINFKEKISDESDLDAFLIFSPLILEKQDYLDIDIGLDYKINLNGIYPIYSSEIDFINEKGLEEFMTYPNLDIYDIKRSSVN